MLDTTVQQLDHGCYNGYMVWFIVWIIIPLLIGLAIFGVGGAVAFAVLGLLTYYAYRIASISKSQQG